MITTDNQQQPTASLKDRILSLPTLLSFAIAIAFIYFLVTRFDFDWTETLNSVRSMNASLYLLGFVLYYLSFAVRGLRWQILARNANILELSNTTLPSVSRCSQLIVIGWFVNSIAWLRMGDAYRAYAFSEDSGNSFSWSLGTVLAERIIDMSLVLVLIFMAVTWFSVTHDPNGISYILLIALLMACILGTVLAIMKGYGTKLARLLPRKVNQGYDHFHKGVLRSLRQLPLLIVLSLAGWILEVGRIYFVVQALDISVWIHLIVITALGHAILSTVPTPGGIGAVEPGMSGLLMLQLSSEDAVSITLLDRSITYLSVIIIGGIIFLLWHLRRRKRH